MPSTLLAANTAPIWWEAERDKRQVDGRQQRGQRAAP